MVEWRSDLAALPLVGTAADPRADSEGLRAWLLANRAEVKRRLFAHGAILFRGFNLASPEQFQAIAGFFCDGFSDYIGGNSPRTRVSSHVFTSTEYPKEERISMHNEA